MRPHISAIICTHKRPHSLRRALVSLAHQTLPPERYEVIVVDNTKDASSREVVEAFPHPNIRYVHEPVVGLSRARNTGCALAAGTYIAYLDDDAIADRHWLERILAAFASLHRPLCVGGTVGLQFETPRPLWLTDELLFCLGHISHPAALVTNGTTTYLHGCNIAFAKEAVVECGGFNTAFGRVAYNLISYEDTIMQDEIKKHGGTCLYDPTICVTHVVGKERLTRTWFTKRMYYEGVSLARMHGMHMSLTERIYAICESFRDTLYAYIFATEAPRTESGRRFTYLCMRRKHVGYLAGLCGF